MQNLQRDLLPQILLSIFPFSGRDGAGADFIRKPLNRVGNQILLYNDRNYDLLVTRLPLLSVSS